MHHEVNVMVYFKPGKSDVLFGEASILRFSPQDLSILPIGMSMSSNV